MRQHFKFFTVVVSIILLSSIILSGSMYAITNKNGGEKPYDLSEQMPTNNTNGSASADGFKEEIGGNVPVDDYIPPILGDKFDIYDHQNGSSLTIFSEEQYNELKAARDNNRRDGLTYDTIIFLVSDSIAKYFSYNEICLYNANIDHILPPTLTFSAIQSSSSCIIRPYHGDFLEFDDYGEAIKQYNRMLEEIYAIIYYRIYMLDSGFIGIEATGSSTYQALVFDNSTSVDDEYKSSLRTAFENIHLSGNGNDSDKKILYTQTDSAFQADSAFDFSFVIAKSDKDRQIIYPTSELGELMPKQRIYCQANEGTKPFFMLDYVTGEAFLTLAEMMSSCRCGKFTVGDGVLTINLDAKDQILVFHKVGGGFAYSAELSQGGEDNISNNWQDGLVFTPLSHASTENSGNESETTSPSTPVDKLSTYIKYDSNSDYCTLMRHEGGDIDGSYSSEDGRMIFLFVTSGGIYQYCFEHIDGNIYSYQKGISFPVPGCEFADETKFCKTTYKNSSSVILEPQ